MKCKRCNGTMKPQIFVDYESWESIEEEGWICCQCGRVVYKRLTQEMILKGIKSEILE